MKVFITLATILAAVSADQLTHQSFKQGNAPAVKTTIHKPHHGAHALVSSQPSAQPSEVGQYHNEEKYEASAHAPVPKYANIQQVGAYSGLNHLAPAHIGSHAAPVHVLAHGHGLGHGLRHGLSHVAPHGLNHGLAHGVPHGLKHGLSHGAAHGLSHGLNHGLAHGVARGAAYGLNNGLTHGAVHGLNHGVAHGVAHGIAHGAAHGLNYGHAHGAVHGLSGHGLPHGVAHGYKPAVHNLYQPQLNYDGPVQYTYGYAVADDYSGNNFAANENRDDYATSGAYRVNLPDGRTQTVNYKVDDAYSGFVADVTYEGEAHYPEYKAPEAYAPVKAGYLA